MYVLFAIVFYNQQLNVNKLVARFESSVLSQLFICTANFVMCIYFMIFPDVILSVEADSYLLTFLAHRTQHSVTLSWLVSYIRDLSVQN